MALKIFMSLLKTYFFSFFGGILSLLTILLLLDNNLYSEDFSIWILIGIFLNVFIPFLFCLVFLLPIAIIENKKIQEREFLELIKRYLPIITIPLSVLFCIILFQDDDYFFIIILLNIYCICCIGLWTFLRKLKSSFK